MSVSSNPRILDKNTKPNKASLHLKSISNKHSIRYDTKGCSLVLQDPGGESLVRTWPLCQCVCAVIVCDQAFDMGQFLMEVLAALLLIPITWESFLVLLVLLQNSFFHMLILLGSCREGADLGGQLNEHVGDCPDVVVKGPVLVILCTEVLLVLLPLLCGADGIVFYEIVR